LVDKPYKIVESGKDYQVRSFQNFSPRDLFWHRDSEDRLVKLLHGEIEIQMENQIPVKLEAGCSFEIPKNVYHRVIASREFSIKVFFLDQK
jgi:quercetin dioxygenase-like cupin family protein